MLGCVSVGAESWAIIGDEGAGRFEGRVVDADARQSPRAVYGPELLAKLGLRATMANDAIIQRTRASGLADAALDRGVTLTFVDVGDGRADGRSLKFHYFADVGYRSEVRELGLVTGSYTVGRRGF